LYACFAYTVYMHPNHVSKRVVSARKRKAQYTLRNIPAEVDQLLRRRAKESARSFNEVAVEALALGSGAPEGPLRDLSDIAGTLTDDDARALDKEIQAQRKIDRKMWK
jgi:hypothetical protein